MKTVQVQQSSQFKRGRSNSPQSSLQQKQTHIDMQGVEKLKQQNINLREEINLEEKTSHNYEVKIMQKLSSLQNNGSNLAKKIETENRRYGTLYRELMITKAQIEEKKKAFSGQGENNVAETLQKLKILEHRQEKYMQKNNELFATILKTKENLKQTRRERVIFDNIFTNIESDLKKKEEEIKSLTLVSSQIDIYKRELDFLQEQIQEIYEMEQEAFQETCKNSLQTPQILQEIDNEQIGLDDQTSQNSDNSQDISDLGQNNLDSELNQNQQQVIDKLESENEKHYLLVQEVKKLNQDIENYEQDLDQLRTKSQNKDISEFLFNYQNIEHLNKDLYQDTKDLQEKISNIQNQIKEIENYPVDRPENFYVINAMDKNHDNKDKKENMIHQIDKIENNYAGISDQNQQILQALNGASQIFPELFDQLACVDEKYLKENIHMNVHPNNILDFIKVLEQKVDEVILMEQALTKNNLYNKVYGKLPFNLKKLKEKEQKLNAINDIIDNLEKQKEGEKIMSIQEFRIASNKEVFKYMPNKPVQINVQQTQQQQYFANNNNQLLTSDSSHQSELQNKSVNQQQQNQSSQQHSEAKLNTFNELYFDTKSPN